MKKHRIQHCALLVLALLGCRERDGTFDQPLSLLGPTPFAGGLAYVERSRGNALFLDVQGTQGSVRSVPVGADPVVSALRPGTSELVVLSRGLRGDATQEPEAATLAAIPTDRTQPPRRYTVGSPFNAFSITPDGRFAFLYYRPEQLVGRLLTNPNEIAIVDLRAPEGMNNPVLRTVRSFGGVPTNVLFSTPFTIRGEQRTFAVVLSESYVTLLDMEHQDRSEVTIRLTLPEDPRAVNPTQLLFDPTERTMYLRAAASNDVYVVRINETTASGPTANDWRPTINQLAAGQGPSDMAFYGSGEERRLLVVSRESREVRVIDPRSNMTITVGLDAYASNLLLFQGPSPRDPMMAQRVLLYGANGQASAVTFLDLTNIAQRRGQNIETVQLGRPITSVLPLPERNAVLLEHYESASGRLNLLDLHRRTASPIVSDISLVNTRFSGDRQTLWVAPPTSSVLGFVDLRNFHPGELRLDAPIADVLTLPTVAGVPDRIAVVHAGNEGYVTIVDAANPQRDTAFSLRGFALTGALNLPEQP